MRFTSLIIVFFLLAISLLSACKGKKENPDRDKPNIIYILADDLGYGDLGVYGQEKIETPNIDALAKSGMLFTQHYSSAPVCAPARYMLMTGLHAGHAYIRGNDEWKERGDVWNYRAAIKDPGLEGQRPIPASTVLFPKKLKEMGYATGMVGKWGLGAPNSGSVPTKMGFDFFFGYNCQRQAHTYYPVHLYRNEERVYLKNDTIPPSTRLPKGADLNDPSAYDAFTQEEYAPDLMYKEMISFIDRHKTSPFYMYWATPIPHVALQAPQRWVDYYIDKFGDEEPYLGDKGYFPHKNPKAAYAAMVSYLDENVGKLLTYLKDVGIYDNTLIIFTSDNGPSYAGGADPVWFNSGGPFKESFGYGKGFVYEAGIRVPMIASWPGRIAPGTTTDLPSVHYDVPATLSELTGFEMPGRTDGISFLPTLLGDGKSQKGHEFLYWEFPEQGGQVAMRVGDWKVIRRNLKNDEPATLELYNLKEDMTEQHNVASQHPEILEKAAQIFEREHEEASHEGFRIPLLENGLLAGSDETR